MNVAAPLLPVVLVTVPPSVPVPLASDAVTSTPLWDSLFPSPSWSWTTGCTTKATPLCAVADGCVVTASRGPSAATAVDVKVTGEPWRPLTDAVVVWSPILGPRMRCTDDRPSEPVATVALDTLPPPCAAHWTPTPSTGSPDASVTLTTSGLASVCPAAPVCPSPDTPAIVVASEGSMLSPPHWSVAAASRPIIVHERTCLSDVITVARG